MTLSSRRAGAMIGAWALTAALVAFANEPVRNGNELALHLSRADAPGRARLARERTGMIHTFRFLHVMTVTHEPARAGQPVILTREPSSDALITLRVSGRLSSQWAADLREGECLAAKGRVAAIETNGPLTVVVDPAVLLHKDNPRPKAGKELLHEVDPRAH